MRVKQSNAFFPRFRSSLWGTLLLACFPLLDGVSDQYLQVPLKVSGLAPGAGEVPLSCSVDLAEMLKGAGLSEGHADHRSLRIFRNEPEGPREFSLQVSPLAHEKGSTRSLPPGRAHVSYLSEFPAQTAQIKTAPYQLSWFAPKGAVAEETFTLQARIPSAGTFVQVPYGAHEFHVFSDEGGASPPRWFPAMHFRPQQPLAGTIHIYDADQLVTSYHVGPTSAAGAGRAFRRPFFYPVLGPDGFPLTGFGKPHDPAGSHAHHYSMWVAHANVDGTDFWSEKGGIIQHESFERLEEGPVFCTFVQRATWRTGETPLLRESRQVTVYRLQEDYRLMDILLEFTPATDKPVHFGKTSFGFLAIRVASYMSPFDGGGEIVNARGQRNEQFAHLQRAEWLDQSGPVAPGITGGIAMLAHPRNAHSPSGWHCRNDGWAGAAFNMEQGYVLEPKSVLALRYRVILHRGNAEAANLPARYREFTANPTIILGEPRLVNQPLKHEYPN